MQYVTQTCQGAVAWARNWSTVHHHRESERLIYRQVLAIENETGTCFVHVIDQNRAPAEWIEKKSHGDGHVARAVASRQ